MACNQQRDAERIRYAGRQMPNAAAAVIYSANRAGGHLTDYSSTPILVTVSPKWLLHRTLELNYGCFTLARIIRRRSRLSADHTASRIVEFRNRFGARRQRHPRQLGGCENVDVWRTEIRVIHGADTDKPNGGTGLRVVAPNRDPAGRAAGDLLTLAARRGRHDDFGLTSGVQSPAWKRPESFGCRGTTARTRQSPYC